MIDCRVKDKILNMIVNNSPEMTLKFDSNNSLKIFGLNRETVCSVLDYFENNGLIDQDKFIDGGIMIEVLIPAHDLFAHGGFTAKEELLTNNIKKLLLEVESLKPLFPDKAEKLTSIISEIAAGLSLFRANRQ